MREFWDHPLGTLIRTSILCLLGIIIIFGTLNHGASIVNTTFAVICDRRYIPFRYMICPSPPQTPLPMFSTTDTHTANGLLEIPKDNVEDSDAEHNIHPPGTPRADRMSQVLMDLEMSITSVGGTIGRRNYTRLDQMNAILDKIVAELESVVPEVLSLQPLFNAIVDE